MSDFRGPPVIVSYLISDEPTTSRELYEERHRSISQAAFPNGKPARYVSFSVGLSPEHLCREVVRKGRPFEAYCQFLVGKITFEVLSRMEMLGLSDEHHLDELSRAALDHLRAAVPGID